MGEKLSRFITNKISRSELYVEVLKISRVTQTLQCQSVRLMNAVEVTG